jgi:hypothetical protein
VEGVECTREEQVADSCCSPIALKMNESAGMSRHCDSSGTPHVCWFGCHTSVQTVTLVCSAQSV